MLCQYLLSCAVYIVYKHVLWYVTRAKLQEIDTVHVDKTKYYFITHG